MERPSRLYEVLAEILRYPGEQFTAALEDVSELLRTVPPEAAGHILAFKGEVQPKLPHEQEELYITTFDLNPLGTLDLGWQLFGEDYNRGLFLAKLRRLMREHGMIESHELPDHLTHVLLLLSRMQAEDAEDFAVACVVPALEKLLGVLKQANPYRSLLLGITMLIREVHSPALEEATHG